jgi:predicted phosphodiesterase
MRIGIISDIHEDAIRLKQALTLLQKQNCDFLVCLGDMAGFDHRFYSYPFTRNLNYCLSAIRDNCRYTIPGNHDLFVLKKIPRWNSIFSFPENWYALSPAERNDLSSGLVWNFEHDLPVTPEKDHFDWLYSLEEYFILENDGLKMLFTHSLFPDPTGMLTRKPVKHADFKPHTEMLADMKCDLGISGHLHPNGVFRVTKRKIIHGKFGMLDTGPDLIQLVCPCVADGNQDNGVTILDTQSRTVEAIPLRTPKHQIIW